MTKLAILSDIHSAAGAYELALESARKKGFDILVILGDLLTYGPFPQETIDMTVDALARHEAVLIEGNHDQIYLGGTQGGGEKHTNGWIEESIAWTFERVDLEQFAGLGWQKELIIEDLLLAHANPHPFGDWTYLRSDEEFSRALEAMKQRGLRYGIFGHSHRHVSMTDGEGVAMTVGSVGQPRSKSSNAPHWASATFARGQWQIEVHPLDFDWGSHCERIRATNLSAATKERLCEFFL